ncbi:MAG TPA: hypothetical protein VMM82_01370, partial [Spirochaetia bacterium]|nr:hypothetical protein [Spirochaetia bacterium]
NGVVKGMNFDEKKSRSTLHVQAVPPSPTMRNRLLTYVYNLFGERELAGVLKKADAVARGPKAEGIMLRATPPNRTDAP